MHSSRQAALPMRSVLDATLGAMSIVLRFRRATLDDVDAIVALVQSAYRGDASRAGWTTEADLLDGQRTDPDEVRALVEDGAGATRILLGLQAEQLVCCAALTREPDASAYVGMVAVRPGSQGSGLGAALLRELERVVVDEGLGTRLRMSVIAQRTELIAWYERRGFQATDAREPFPYGNPRFGLPRRPDLYFRWLTKTLSAL
jgi:ribosomal protein S18 acetylase RimI-like enzyme